MKVAIVGSRKFDNYDLLKTKLQAYEQKATLVISGGAKGADQLAERWSKEFLKKEATIIRPNWKDTTHPNALIKYDKTGNIYDAKAGIRRNERIAQQADIIFAFWDGQSKGTRQIILYARQIGKTVEVVKYRDATQLTLPF